MLRVSAVERVVGRISVVTSETFSCFVKRTGTSDGGSSEGWTVKVKALYGKRSEFE